MMQMSRIILISLQPDPRRERVRRIEANEQENTYKLAIRRRCCYVTARTIKPMKMGDYESSFS